MFSYNVFGIIIAIAIEQGMISNKVYPMIKMTNIEDLLFEIFFSVISVHKRYSSFLKKYPKSYFYGIHLLPTF